MRDSPKSPPERANRKVSSSSVSGQKLLAQHRARQQLKKLGQNLDKNAPKVVAAASEQQPASHQRFQPGFRVPPLLNMDSPSQQLVREAAVSSQSLPFGPFGTFPEGHNSHEPAWKPNMNYSFTPAVVANSDGSSAHANTFPYGASAPNNNFITDPKGPMFPNAAIVSDQSRTAPIYRDATFDNTAARQAYNVSVNHSTAHLGNAHLYSAPAHDTAILRDAPLHQIETLEMLNTIRTTVQRHAARISTISPTVRPPQTKRVVAELGKLIVALDEVAKHIGEIYAPVTKEI